MAMSVFYNLLKPNKQAAKLNTPRAKPTESIITQVQKPGATTTTTNAPTQLLTPKGGVFTIGKCIPTFMANCLTRKRENLFKDENSFENDGNYLLPKQSAAHKGRKTLVLDLDETLVHSSFDKVKNPDSSLSLTIKGTLYNFSVMVRPGTEEFFEKACEDFEVVIFTASLMDYAQAIMKLINKKNLQCHVLAREHCTQYNGVYVKDLTRLGRDIKNVILVDNSPNAFRFQPENAYHIKDFFDDKKDRELYALQSCLEHLNELNDVRPIKTHRMVFEGKSTAANSTQSISTETTIKSHRASTQTILKTEETLTLIKQSAKTARDLKPVSTAEAEALSVIRKMIDKKKNAIVKPESIKTGLLANRVRTSELSTATKTSKEEGEENIEELILRRPVADNNNDELDSRCQTETELPLMSLARQREDSSRSISRQSSESGSDSGEARDTDERMYYAIEARVC